jgi:hypothetical protein
MFTNSEAPRLRNRFGIFPVVCSLLVVSAFTALGAKRNSTAIAVFMNEGGAQIQVNVISRDKTDKTILPLRPGAIERTLFTAGELELYTPSEDVVSGRLLFTLSLPTPATAPEFMEKGTRTFYFRIVDEKIKLVKARDLTPKERNSLAERTKRGW